MCSIVDANSSVRVSSVLNRDTKQFGKKYLFDGLEDTCWNSDQGSPQWIHVKFEDEKNIQEIRIKFQGGFAGRECWVELHDSGEPVKLIDFYPEDISSQQIFKLPVETKTTSFRIVFNNSTDFFGRVTIYELIVLGLS